jgi:hypothetical protein
MTRSALHRWATALVAAALLAVAVPVGPAGAGAGRRALTIYAVATRAQFTDHSDDRTRSVFKNPFNVDGEVPGNTGKGPHTGDNALYSFTLYSDTAFKKRIGSAVYACTFNVAHKALCEADFQLNGGAMFASGPANFDSTYFTLAVSGGTGKYLGTRGQVSSAPTGKNAHRLRFLLR